MTRRRPLAVFVQGGGGQRHRGDGLPDAVYLHARQFLLLALRHQTVELGGAVADQSSQVAHKLVDEALALHLADHVAVVVVPERGGGELAAAFPSHHHENCNKL